MNSAILAFVVERAFKYGGLWVHYEELEGVRETMVALGQDTTTLDERMALARELMAQYHSEVQERVAGHHLMLGYCEPSLTVCAIDDSLP